MIREFKLLQLNVEIVWQASVFCGMIAGKITAMQARSQ